MPPVCVPGFAGGHRLSQAARAGEQLQENPPWLTGTSSALPSHFPLRDSLLGCPLPPAPRLSQAAPGAHPAGDGSGCPLAWQSCCPGEAHQKPSAFCFQTRSWRHLHPQAVASSFQHNRTAAAPLEWAIACVDLNPGVLRAALHHLRISAHAKH